MRRGNQNSTRNLESRRGNNGELSLTFCCCRFRCQDKSHKEKRGVTNNAQGRAAVYNMMISREGEEKERKKEGGSNYSQIPLCLSADHFPKIRSMVWAWTRGLGMGGRLSDGRMVGWFWSEEMLRCLRFRLPSSSGGEQQLGSDGCDET